MANVKSKYLFPKTDPKKRPPVWWYVAWVVYANRQTFIRASVLFAIVIGVLFLSGLLLDVAALVVTVRRSCRGWVTAAR